jgi:hypothetical protein
VQASPARAGSGVKGFSPGKVARAVGRPGPGSSHLGRDLHKSGGRITRPLCPDSEPNSASRRTDAKCQKATLC